MERYDDSEAAKTSGCNSSTSLTTLPPEVAVGTTVPNNVDIVGDSVILYSDILFKGVQTLFQHVEPDFDALVCCYFYL